MRIEGEGGEQHTLADEVSDTGTSIPITAGDINASQDAGHITASNRRNVLFDDGESDAVSDDICTWKTDILLDADTGELPTDIQELVATDTGSNKKDEGRQVCMPPHVKRLIQYLQKENRDSIRWMSEAVRRLLVHGLKIHMHSHGSRLSELMSAEVIAVAITSHDTKILNQIQDDTKFNGRADRCYHVHCNSRMWETLDDARDEAGFVDKERWMTFLLLLSLQEHPDLSSWYKVFHESTDDIQEQLQTRIEKLERLTGYKAPVDGGTVVP